MLFKERQKGHAQAPKNRSAMKVASQAELEEYLSAPGDNSPGVIYFHVPFCDNICSFCAMNRTKKDTDLSWYADFLVSEIEKYAHFAYFKNKEIASIYFGGGTPTALSTPQISQVLEAINKNFKIAKDVEYSCESTLHNLSEAKLDAMSALGVNRYSIGIQSFNDYAREYFKRVHDRAGAINAIKRLRSRFPGQLCIDIIYNYPGQSIEDVLSDAKLCAELGIDSVSFYSLMYFESSTLFAKIDTSYYDQEHDKALHDAFLATMQENGFNLLEHSKLIKNDRYRYIRMSHAGADILPLGQGAGGGVGPFSIFNVQKDMKMIAKRSETERELSRLCNLFQYQKVDLEIFAKRLKPATFSLLLDFLKRCEKENYLKLHENSYEIDFNGVFWGNSIASGAINIIKDDFLETKIDEKDEKAQMPEAAKEALKEAAKGGSIPQEMIRKMLEAVKKGVMPKEGLDMIKLIAPGVLKGFEKDLEEIESMKKD